MLDWPLVSSSRHETRALYNIANDNVSASMWTCYICAGWLLFW